MRRLATLVIIFACTSIAATASNQVQVEILLIERNPWLMVIESDSPTFVLYDNGQAIWWRQLDGSNGEYRNSNLKPKELDDLKSKIVTLSNLGSYYELTSWTDQASQEIYFRKGSSLNKIEVYGDLRLEEEIRNSAPSAFLNLFDHLSNFEHPESKIWKPQFIEIMIWPYEYAPGESIVWPSNWPDTKSASTRARGDSYSIYLSIKHENEFTSFISTINEKGAVLINGRKWAVSKRIPFPHEINNK